MKVKKILLFPAFALIGSGLSGCSLLPSVTFYDEDGKTILERDENVRLGSMASYDGKTPEKKADKKYTYKFAGWDRPLTKVWGMNVAYTAVYDKEDRYYEITWKNGYGTDPLAVTKEKYGAIPQLPKDGYGDLLIPKYSQNNQDAQYEYTFTRWNPQPHVVEGEQEYTPEFEKTVRKYDVVFLDANGQTFGTVQKVEYGQLPKLPDTTPDKASTAQYDYVFKGWSPSLEVVTGPQTYTPEYDEVIRSYTVTFKDWEGNTIGQPQTLNYGAIPTPPQLPDRDPTAEKVYEFIGWRDENQKDIHSVTGNAVYTATYNERARLIFQMAYFIKNEATGEWVKQPDNLYPFEVYEHSDYYLPTITDDYYDIVWYGSKDSVQPVLHVEDVFDNMDFYGIKQGLHEYSVTYHLDGGQLDDKTGYPSKVTHEDLIFLPEAIPGNNLPVKPGYDFIGWTDKDGDPFTKFKDTTSDIELFAQYNEATFNISFAYTPALDPVQAVYNDDGYLEELPNEHDVSVLGYTFKHWEYNGVKLEGPFLYTTDITVNPVFEINKYQLSYELNGGIVNTKPSYYTIDTFHTPLPEPTKTGYDFEYWEFEVDNVSHKIYPGQSLADSFASLFSGGYAQDLILIACYSNPHVVTVYYDYDGGVPLYTVTYMDEGNLVGVQNVAYEIGEAEFVKLQDKNVDGTDYQFAGWRDEDGHLVKNTFEINKDITLTAVWNEVSKRWVGDPSDTYNNQYLSDQTVVIDDSQSVIIYNHNGTYLQFTSLVDQTLTLTAAANFEIYVAGTDNAECYGLYDALEKVYSNSFVADAGQSYTIKIKGVENNVGTVELTLSSEDPTKTTPDWKISAEEFLGVSPQPCAFGEEIPGLITLAKKDCVFDGWYIGSKHYNPGDKLDVETYNALTNSYEVTVVAHWHQLTPTTPAP